MEVRQPPSLLLRKRLGDDGDEVDVAAAGLIVAHRKRAMRPDRKHGDRQQVRHSYDEAAEHALNVGYLHTLIVGGTLVVGSYQAAPGTPEHDALVLLSMAAQNAGAR